MNRIYKSIWNEQTGTYVAVSENVKAKGKRSGSSVLASAILAITVGVSAQAQTVTVGNGFNVEDLHKFSGDTITIAGAVGAPVTLITNNNVQVGSDVNLNTTGLVITGGPSVTQSGINAGNKKITNVAAGALNAGSTDAVNGAQLNATNQNVTTAQNAANAAQNTANKGLIVRANSGATDTLALGDTLTFVNGTNTTVAYDAASNTFRTNLNSNLTGLTGVNTASLNVTNNATVGGTLNVTGSSTLSGGANLGNKKITNLADGAVEAGSKDAVTGGQIFDQLFGDEAEGIKYFRVTSEKADAKAEGVDSIAIGPEANSEGVNSIAIGLKSEALANNSFAAGNDAVVTEEGESAIALGNGATAGGGAPGAGGTAAIAIGRDSAASGSSSVALGDASVASASKATALGADSQATAANAIAIGGGSANATGSFAAGLGATVAAGSNNSISLGTGAGAGINPGDADDRIDLIAIGTNAGRNVGGSQNIAIGAGSGSDVSGYFNLALGQNSGTGLGVGSDSVVSIGREANYNVGKTLQHAVAIGSYTKAATNAVSIGHQSDALAAGVAIGYAADAAENAVALGTNADAVSGSVALGLNSAASALDWAGASYLTNQATPGSVVSVGNRNEGGGDATLRRIVNVADGAATSDAATVGQLQKAQTEVAGLIGGGVSVNADGSFSDFTVKDKAGNSHTFGSVAEGFALLANGTIELLPATAVTFVSDTDKRIAGVAAGINNEDVVNVGQLKQELAANKVQYFHVNSSIDTNKVSNGAKGENAMAIGPDAVAGGDSSIAFGHDVTTSAAQSIAIGNDVDAIGLRSTVIGNSGTMATHEGGVAIGENAHSYGENSIVIGTGARSHLADSVVPNHNTVVIGTSAEATADNGTAIGMDAVATDERAVALGTTAQARGEDSMAFGSNALATGVSAQASGTNANASGLNAQASGTGASASGYNAVATGTGAVGYATDGIAMGTGAISGFSDPFNNNAARNTAGIAIGKASLADEEHALALGVDAEARAKFSTAIGDGAEATVNAVNGFAAGTNALVSAQNATAIGANTDATGINASAFGNGAQATAGSALALGDGADAEGLNSTAMGTGANAQKANSMALGTNAIAYHEGSVALGSGSVTGTVNVTRTPEATVDGVKYDFAGAQPGVTSTVSVGSVGNERTISNVAAGQLNEKSTDAVNGSQLHATNKAVTALGNNLDTFGDSVASALGGTSKYNPATHTVTAGLSVNGNPYTNVNDALQYVGQGWDVSGSGTNQVNIGPGGAVDFKGDSNISVAQTGEKDAGVIAINLAKDVDLGADGSLTTGNTKVNNTGVTVGSGGFAPTTTVEAGKIVVTSAGGTGNNKSIVLDTSPTKAEITGLTNTTWNPAGTYNAGRAATEEQLKMVSDVAQNANQGWNVTTNADDATSENVAPGATVDFDNTDGNIVIGQTGTKLTFDLADNLSVGGDGVDGKVGVKGADGKDGVSINPDAIVFHGIDGVDGKDGSLTMGKGEPGVDGVDGITRIQYTDPDGKDYEVATLNDGLNFAGDIGSISHKLNETVSLTGGVDDADKLSDDANIGVVAGSAGGLLLRLAKDLTGLTSATFSDGTNTTVVNGEGLTIDGGPSVTVDGIDGGDKQITGVASGLGGTKLADATGNILTNAANIGDLQSAANNLTNAGLNFVGNTGGAIHKDLGDTLSIGGGLADGAASTGANLRVDSDGSKLNLVMARNLTDLESITINNGGPVINAGGINMNGNKITGLEAGTADTDAVNVSQLKGVEETANKGWNVSSNDGGETKNVAPGATVDFDNTDGNIVIAQEGTDLTFDLADDIEIGNSITVGGTTNQTVINEGSVTTNNLTVDGRTQLGDNFIVSEDNSVTYNGAEIANLDDGLSFKGDDGTVVSRKLNETLDLTGGATGALSDNNIGVVADGTGALSIQLAKNIDLGADGSLTTGNTVVNNAGVKVAGVSPNDPSTSVEAGRIVVASSGGAGNNQSIVLNTTPTTAEITGLTNRDLNAADFATAGRAATEEQLQLVSENLTEEGLNFAGNTGDEIHKDLGETLRIAGGLDNAASASDANLRVDSENGELRIKLATS
ncbi:hypothetical protein KU392_09055, partial [Advenella alkanexedens]|nr:hypothetical protein [Advenella alkanexedens]